MFTMLTLLTSLSVVFPVFAVIAAGFACGRLGLLGPTASSELNRFVVYLGLPALLFQVMAEANWPVLWQPGFMASFAIGIAVIFGGTLIYQVASGRHLTDASIDGLNAGYANVGYIGFPLCELIFGRQSLALVTIATIMTVSVLFAVAIIFVEIGLQAERRPHRLLLKIGKALIRNPLLVAPLLGAVWSTFQTPVPEAAKTVLHLVGNAASPCALVSLGLFLAARHRGRRSSRPVAMTLAGLKLIVQPANRRHLRLWHIQAAAGAGCDRRAAIGVADRYRPVHGRRILQTGSRRDVRNDPLHDDRIGRFIDSLSGAGRSHPELDARRMRETIG